MTRALQSVVPHAFGEHQMCGDWCSYQKNQTEYKQTVDWWKRLERQ